MPRAEKEWTELVRGELGSPVAMLFSEQVRVAQEPLVIVVGPHLHPASAPAPVRSPT